MVSVGMMGVGAETGEEITEPFGGVGLGGVGLGGGGLLGRLLGGIFGASC